MTIMEYLSGQPWWSDKIRQNLQRRRGVRLGEAAVVSRQVHLSESRTPGLITILTSADAGRVFYGRATPGEVIHVDIFHEVAEVDHRRVAEALLQALGTYWAPGEESTGRLLLDYFDLVTATGGGRVTGDLTYGRSASLRAAHRNHVHVAGRLPDDHLELLLPLVAAVEAELRAQGVEPRRVERLIHVHWSGGAPLDLSAYTDPDSDSLLTAHRREGGAGSAGGPGLRPGRAAPQAGRGEAGPGGGGTPGAGGSGSPGTSVLPGPDTSTPGVGWPESRSLVDPWEALRVESQMQAALELSRRLGSPEEVRRVLRELARQQGWNSLYGSGNSQAPYLLKELEDAGLVRRDIRGMRLTEKGVELAAFLEAHFREVKLRFRKLIRRITFPQGRWGSRHPGRTLSRPSPHVRYGPIRGTAPAEPGTWLTDLAVPESIRAALIRSRLAAVGGTAASDCPPLRLEREDIHVCLRSVEPVLHICLLIDASASMAGRRILAAKHLARHLLVSTRDKVAVIAFQEREVRVCVPFTRNYAEVEEGLALLQPLGLTPLADGLVRSVELIRQSRVRRPLLLLITDGIPTVPKWSVDPLADALEAARLVNAARIPFGCIGLQPGRRYLTELAQAAGGTLHVVEELEEESLVAIAHRERWKMVRR